MKLVDDGTSPLNDLSSVAYASIRDLIVAGKLAPGAPVIETDLAARLGVSRTPIRSALQRLQQEGFILTSRVGQSFRAVVSPLTVDDMREVHLIVGALEGLAAALAARLVAKARETLAKRMAALNAIMTQATTARPPQIGAAQNAHLLFHRLYVDAAAGPRLRMELDAIRPQAERYERVYTSALIGDFGGSLVEHDVIVQAIRSGDAERAERAVIANWRNGADRYRGVVDILGERGAW